MFPFEKNLKISNQSLSHVSFPQSRNTNAYKTYFLLSDKSSEKVIQSYTIITTTPNEIVGKYHDRMPVILDKEGEATWLNLDIEVDQLHPLLKPFPTDEMTEWEVGAAARDPRND